MAKIQKFEDIEAWQKSRELTRRVYKTSSQGEFSRDFGLRDQIRRAAVSVMSNIAEGYERGGDKEFRQFLALAKGSVGELKSQLYVALDVGFVSELQFGELYELANETARLIAGFMRYLSTSNLKGAKYR
jgi:four helix bundle protein